MAQRALFAAFHENWSEEDWSNVVFSDESKLFPRCLGKQKLRKYHGERVQLHYINQESHGTGV